MPPEPTASRKPLVVMESREPRSIRFNATEWLHLSEAARTRGVEASTFVRECALMGLTMTQSPALMEAYVRALSVLHRESGVLRASHGKAGA